MAPKLKPNKQEKQRPKIGPNHPQPRPVQADSFSLTLFLPRTREQQWEAGKGREDAEPELRGIQGQLLEQDRGVSSDGHPSPAPRPPAGTTLVLIFSPSKSVGRRPEPWGLGPVPS